MRKVILDANVILSAVLFGGIPLLLLDALQEQVFTLCISEQLCDEVIDKLTNKFKVSAVFLNDISVFFDNGIMYTPTQKVHFPQDPDDAYLLELAEKCSADYLVTGDKKHLLPLGKWKTTRILKPQEAIKLLRLAE